MEDFVKGLAISQLIPKKIFKDLVQKWEIDKGVTKLQSHKLFDILALNAFFEQKTLRDMALSYGVPKSTIDDALCKRSCGFFEELLPIALAELTRTLPDRRLRQDCRDLIAIDSTICNIHGSLADKFRTTKMDNKKAGVKAHIAWDVNNQWIEECQITSYRNNDCKIGKRFEFKSEKTYVFDRAYVDIKLWDMIVSKGAHFVTRLKKSGKRLDYIRDKIENIEDVGVLYDGKWTPSETACSASGIKKLTLFFRLVIYRDSKSKKLFYFITSDFNSQAQEIADIYRKRWAVELLFRWLKGHLNIRRSAFKNLNAIKIQLCIAVLVQLFIRYKMIIENFNGTSWDYLRRIRFAIEAIVFKTLTGSAFYGDAAANPLLEKVLPT